MTKTRRKINFEAVIRYTAYPWGRPGSSPMAEGADNEPVACSSHTGALAMNSADAREQIVASLLSNKTNVAEVTGVELTLRHPTQDAELLAERDARAA